MKLFNANKCRFLFLALTAVLPLVTVTAANNQTRKIEEIVEQLEANHQRQTLQAHEAQSMLSFEGFQGLLSRYFATQEAYYPMAGGCNTDFYLDGLSQDNFTNLGTLGLQQALAYNENGFQLLLFNGSGNADYALQFSNVMRKEAAYFVSLVLYLIDNDPSGVEFILNKWADLPEQYGFYFSQFQPDNPHLAKQIKKLAKQLKAEQIAEAEAIAQSFVTGDNNLGLALVHFKAAFRIAEAMILTAVPQ